MLRYTFKTGSKAQMVMTLAMSSSIGMGAAQAMALDLPIIKTVADIGITAVSANGDATYDLVFTNLTAEPPPGGDPSMAAMVQKQMASVNGLKASATVSNRGLTTATKLTIDQTNPALAQMTSQMTSSIENMSVPFPAEAVGTGARWEVRQTLTNGGTTIYQRTECELVSADASSVKLNVKIEQTGPRQTLSGGAGLPGGMSMDVESITGSGTGTMTLRLDSLVPTSEMSTNTSMAIAMGTQKANMDMKAKMSVAPGPAK